MTSNENKPTRNQQREEARAKAKDAFADAAPQDQMADRAAGAMQDWMNRNFGNN